MGHGAIIPGNRGPDLQSHLASHTKLSLLLLLLVMVVKGCDSGGGTVTQSEMLAVSGLS